MSMFLSRSLALVTSFMLLLPPCWCCYLGAGECCSAEKQQVGNTQPAEEESPCPCCAHDSKDPSQKNPSSKPNNPDKPAKLCCEQTPIDRATSHQPLPDLTVLIPGHSLFETPPLPAAIAVSDFAPVLVGSPPPVHVLHCVWLC